MTLNDHLPVSNHRLSIYVLGAVLLVLCSTTLGCDEQPILISRQQEIELGEQVHQELIKEFGEPLPQNHVLSQFISELGNQLATFSERPKIPHQFFVLDNPMVNAFAGPGGFVYVTTGLIEQAQSLSELISVLAHEVGHVSRAHSIRRLQLQLGTSYLADIILGKGALTDVTNVMMAVYLNTGYSQENEYEADAFAVMATGGVSYNPWGLVKFFEFIQQMTGDTPSFLKFISTHPSPADRIQHAKDLIASEFPEAPRGGSSSYRENHSNHAWTEVQGWLPAPASEQ